MDPIERETVEEAMFQSVIKASLVEADTDIIEIKAGKELMMSKEPIRVTKLFYRLNHRLMMLAK